MNRFSHFVLFLSGLTIFAILNACTPGQVTSTEAAPTTAVKTLRPKATPTRPKISPTPTIKGPTATIIIEQSIFGTTPTTGTIALPSIAPTMAFIAPTPGPLTAQDPHLVYYKSQGTQNSLILFNQDGSGSQTITLPQNGYIDRLEDQLQPLGEWVAFFTQSADGDIPVDLALNLMHLPDGKTTQLTNLVSQDFPDNLDILAENLAGEPEFAGVLPGELIALARASLATSLRNTSWSPNGRYLAFSSEAIGPSSDLFVYDTQTRKTTRLSDGMEHVVGIHWLQDNNRILHIGSKSLCEGDCVNYYLVNIMTGDIQKVEREKASGATSVIDQWASSTAIILHTAAYGLGECCLRSLDLETGKETGLFNEQFSSYAIDSASSSIALTIPPSQNREPGVYVYKSSDGSLTKIAEFTTKVGYLGWKDYPFIAYGSGVVAFNPAGLEKTFSELPLAVIPSPVDTYLALIDQNSSYFDRNGLKVLDQDGKLLLDIPGINVSLVSWRPDANGLFFITMNTLFYVDIPDGTPILLEDIPQTNQNLLPGLFLWVK